MKRTPIISTDKLSFGYGHHQTVISDVSCNISENTFTVIMGKNGSGKSTFLRLLGGIMPYHKGSIKVGNVELKELKLEERAKMVGFLPQHHKPVFPFKVSEVVLAGRASYIQFTPNRTDEYQADKALELIGISSLRNRIYSELSGGEQQLVMIARLLAQQPKILLLDEPISHLDYYNQIRILKLIKELVSNDITVVAVLHDPNMAYLFGEKFIYVHDGQVHEVNDQNAWEHQLVNEIFDNQLFPVEHKGKYIFIPQV
ncbi:MAG: ABC transporter ATP-binding protein [Bacteroidales bacterium]